MNPPSHAGNLNSPVTMSVSLQVGRGGSSLGIREAKINAAFGMNRF